MTDEREEPGVLSGLDSFTDPAAGDGGSRRLWTAFWAAADKGLPMLYGVAVVLIVVGRLETAEFGIWVVFQTIFLAISLFGDYLLLQPIVGIIQTNAAVPISPVFRRPLKNSGKSERGAARSRQQVM